MNFRRQSGEEFENDISSTAQFAAVLWLQRQKYSYFIPSEKSRDLFPRPRDGACHPSRRGPSTALRMTIFGYLLRFRDAFVSHAQGTANFRGRIFRGVFSNAS